jgi:hypothetical protein
MDESAEDTALFNDNDAHVANEAIYRTSVDDKALLRNLKHDDFPSVANAFADPLKNSVCACKDRHQFLKRSQQPEALPADDVLYWTANEDRSLLHFSRDENITTWNQASDEFIDPLKTADKCADRYKFLAEKIKNTLEQEVRIDTEAQSKIGFIILSILFSLLTYIINFKFVLETPTTKK